MLFKRSAKQSFFQKVRNLIWPKMGLKRLLYYYRHRTIRIPAGEVSVALGLAFGCAVSWTPTFGTHLLQCVLFCWLTRANWIAAFLGSALGNPWTTPLMMLISYHVGKALMIATGYNGLALPNQDVEEGFKVFIESILNGHVTWALIVANFKEYLLPALIGGYVMALATFPLFFFPFYYMIKGARLARKTRIMKKIEEEVVEIIRHKDLD